MNRPTSEPAQQIYDALVAEQRKRGADPKVWQARELDAVHQAAVRYCDALRIKPPTREMVRQCEAQALVYGAEVRP